MLRVSFLKFRFNLFLLTGLIFALFVVGGCGLLDRIQGLKRDSQLIYSENSLPPEDSSSVLQREEKVKVTLYFKDKEGRFLVPQVQEITKVPGIGRAALDALCEGPVDADLLPSLPDGAKVRDLNIRPDGTCIVDLNLAATKISDQDPKTEALAVYAVVNTLTEFPTVKSVQILIEGQVQKTLAGHIPIDEPLLRNLTFVKK